MAIGKDVYCDSRLIIRKLEELFPDSTMTPPSSAHRGTSKLLESWTIDGGVFGNAVRLMPYWTNTGLLSNKAFLDDRQQLRGGGGRMTAETMQAGRPDGLIHIRQTFELMENTFLADGRQWILGGDTPTTADIDGVWPFEWLVWDQYMRESLPEEFVSAKKFPKTYAYIKRFMEEAERRKQQGPKPTRLDGKQMKEKIINARSPPASTTIIDDDPLNLKEGDEVEVYASDYGFTHKDRGTLIGLTISEVVIRNSVGLHLHFPRWNFKIDRIQPNLTLPKSLSAPKMKLIYHHASPYTRKVFMLALELGLASSIHLEKVVVCPVDFKGWSDNNIDVAPYNPMAKIPCLVPGDVPDGIFDSRTICDYLESTAKVDRKKDSRYWQLNTLHACSDGILDACILLVYEKRIREPLNVRLESWVVGQHTKINRGLDRLETAAIQNILPDPASSGPASSHVVAVVVTVAFMDVMDIKWREGRPKLSEWFARWETRQSLIDSPFDKEWASVAASHTSIIPNPGSAQTGVRKGEGKL
jgi:glutathione S-transferase